MTPAPLDLPDPALILLVGPSGSGKSTWAAARFRSPEIASSDDLRGVVGSGPADLDASAEAFELLDRIVAARTRRRLPTVIDTLGLDSGRRLAYVDLGKKAGLPCVAVVFTTPASVCRVRNSARDRPVPAPVLASQVRKTRGVADELAAEGWDLVVTLDGSDGQPPPAVAGADPGTQHLVGSAAHGRLLEPGRMSLVLNVARFPWGTDPAGWLRGIALAAAEAGFAGLALMDHLIQIPQVGRAWEPIPEPFVTLGLLAGLGCGLHLGTLVSPVTLRAPGMLAKAVATLDTLSGGRAFCGLGAGWWEREHAAYGLAFPSAGDRLDEVERAIGIIRALWAPGTKEWRGSGVHLPETTCYPRPIGAPPIIVGGGGEQRTLRIAARLADACNISSDSTVLDRKIAVLQRHCITVGRDPQQVAVTVLDVPIAGDDRDDAWARVERLRGRTPAATFAARHHAGTVAEHAARYRTLAERGVRAVFVSMPDLAGPEDVHRLAPLVAATH